MDIFGAINAAIAFFVANWVQIECLARNIAADAAAVYALALLLAKALKPFFPVLGQSLEDKVIGFLVKK